MIPAEEAVYASNKVNVNAALETYEKIIEETKNPRKTSEETLLRILADNNIGTVIPEKFTGISHN